MPPLLSLAILLLALGLTGRVLIRRRRSRAALVARVAELTLLSEVGRAIVSAELDEAQLAQLIYRQAGQIVETRFFQVGLFEGDSYRTLIRVRDGERIPDQRFELPPEENDGILGWVRRTRQPLLVRDFEAEMPTLPARPRYLSADPPRSAIFLPLVAGESCLGAMAIQSRAPGAFSLDHLRLLSILANQVAAALANARLFQQTSARARELELIAAVSRQISTLQPLPDLFRDVVKRIAAASGYPVVNLFERTGDRLALRASTSATLLAAPPVLQVGEGLVGRAAADRAPALARHAADSPPDPSPPALEAARLQLAVPLLVEDDVLGVLDIHCERPDPFTPETVRLMESLAAQLAIAILEANNYQATRRRADHLAAVAESAAAVASILVLDDLLDEVVDLVQDHLGYERAAVFLLEGDALAFRAGIGGPAARWRVEGHTVPLNDPGALATAARRRSPTGGTARPVGRLLSESPAPPSPDENHPASELAVPLIMAGRVLGVLHAQSSQPGAFGPDDQQVLQTLAGSLAVAVRNARLFAAERRRRVLAETMRDVSTALAASLELDDVLGRILAGLARLVPFDAASILLMEEPGRYVLRAATGPDSLTGAVGRRIELDEPAPPGPAEGPRQGAPAVEAGTGPPADPAVGAPAGLPPPGPDRDPLPAPALNFEALDLAGQYHQLLGPHQAHTCVGVPLAAGGDRLGYLVVDRRPAPTPKSLHTGVPLRTAAPQEMGGEEMELIVAFASQATVAIENARLYTAQREEAWVSTALLQVAEASARAERLEDVLAIAARLTAMLVGVNRCGILLSDADGTRLSAGAPSAYSAGGEALEDSLRLLPGEWPPLEEALQTRAAVVVEPGAPLPEPILRGLGLAGETGVLILLPLLTPSGGQAAGAMLVSQSPGEPAFIEHRVRLMGGIAGQAALAIERARLRESWQEEAWVSMALLQVAEAVALHTELSEGLETIARLVPLLAGVRWAAIYRAQAGPDGEDTRLIPATQYGLDPARSPRFAATPLRPEALDLAPEELAAAAPPKPVLPAGELAEALGSEPCLALPLRAGGEFLGALVVSGPGPAGRRMDLLNGFAHQLALAIERARLADEVVAQQRLEREVEVARGIQASFLPDACPLFPGWEVCSHWQVARRVGGDFYDFIPLALPQAERGERWGVVIADVADKGVPAALFMALSRTLLRAAAAPGHGPGETLRQVNDLILADTRSDLFVTVCYMVLEPQSGRATYAVGGHNPPVLVRAGGEATLLRGRGPALGLMPGVEYANHQLLLEPGDVLLLYTDGITEAINAAEEEFGLARLVQMACQHRAASAADMVRAVALAVEAHAGDMEAFDDQTLVVIKRHAERAALSGSAPVG